MEFMRFAVGIQENASYGFVNLCPTKLQSPEIMIGRLIRLAVVAGTFANLAGQLVEQWKR